MRIFSFSWGAGLLLGLISFTPKLAAQTSPPTGGLTNAAQVRDLTSAQAEQAWPVTLTGIVIDNAAPNRQAVILQDQTAAMYVLATPNLFGDYHRGDWVEIKGVTDPGGFAPIVRASVARKLGTNMVPEAQPVTYQDLITGAMDGQWVEIKGVVRQCFIPAAKSDMHRIAIAMDGGLIPVRFVTQPGHPIETDEEVRVQAVCYYQYNQKRQVLNPVLQVPRGVPIIVEKTAPPDPYGLPPRPAHSLLEFSPKNASAYTHRIHVRGVVTCSQPASAVWIRDGSSGLRIQTQQPTRLQPGDKIEALGFLSFSSHTPALEDSIFQKTGTERPPVPLALTNYTESFNHEDDLIDTEAMLTDLQTAQDGVVFALDKDGKKFKAILKLPAAAQMPPEWQVGSQVRVTGICSLVYDEGRPQAGIWQPQLFQILLRSPADLKIIRPPHWWTPKHIIFLLGGFVIGSLLVTGWAILLSRRRVHEQERRREMAEAEFGAILSERNRLAREIHDTLAQGLGAISMQLELVKSRLASDSSRAGEHLDQAHRLVRSSLADARDSIWNMRSQVLETGDLASALKGVLQQLSGNTGVEGQMRVHGRLRRLPPVTENNLLRAGQEAITNAMKHAQAKRIEVDLEFAEKEVRLRVKDNGRGFDTAHPPASESGFGLMGMRERVEELHGRLTVRSSAGQGTEITLTVPVAG